MRTIALLSLLLFTVSAWAQDPQVTASVDSDTVGVQDQFQFTITVSGAIAATPKIRAFQTSKDSE